MICKTYETDTLKRYKYVVTLSRYKGKILMSRHKERTTWEAQGGHIEPGETPLQAAKRELYEESGALEYTIVPLCDYWAGEREDGIDGAGGMVFVADIETLGPLPESEMAQVQTFEWLPENLTYPEIAPVLYGKIGVSFRPGFHFAKDLEKEKLAGESERSKGLSGRLLYGTGNLAKVEAMRRRLKPLGLELMGLKDMEGEIPVVEEDGATPLENAKKKAVAYYQTFRIPVFSCDSGLYIEGFSEEEQPGVHVRTVKGKYLTDAEMLEHYAGMARRYGNLKARYRNAICLVLDEVHIYSAMEASMESKPFLIVSRPHSAVRNPGFPLDSLSVDIQTGKYFYELEPEAADQVAVEDGFLEFFRKYL